MIALIIALLIADAPNASSNEKAIEEASKDADLNQAQECRVYTQFAVSLFATEPSHSIFKKAHNYWKNRTEDIGAKYGLSPQAVDFQSLVIKLDQKRLDSVWASCLKAIPPGSLL